MEGSIQPEGIDLNYLSLPVEEIFYRTLMHQEFDVAELSLSSYLLSLQKEEKPFIAIPVFPSCAFRHSGIFINANSGIKEPKDLIGKRIGTPEYQMTAAVWIRGMLQDHYGVGFDQVQYLTGGAEQPGRQEKIKLQLPDNIHVEPIGPQQTLSQMLRDGEIDALYTARTPSCFNSSQPQVQRLFPNYGDVEREYFKQTSIFPIMHVMVIKRSIYEAHPWVARSLYKAFLESQKLVYQDMKETVVLKTMFPWMNYYLDQVRSEMGEDFWPWNIEKTQHTIETLMRYSCEHGILKRPFTMNEIFAKETFSGFKI
jgi:4,5-dihydroxyphthalate decarboxylase